MRRTWPMTAFLVTTALVSDVAAQPSRGATELMTPVLAEQSDATAIAANPGQIPLLRGWNLTYLTNVIEQGPNAGQGHGLYFAMPIRWGLAWGASVELVRPAGEGGTWRSPFTVALGWQWAERLSIGLASRWFFSSEDPAVNGLWAIDLGVTLRLGRHFAAAVTAHSINDPRAHGARLTEDVRRFGRQWSVGFVLRPTGRDLLSLAGEVTYAEAWERLIVRGVVGLRPIPGWTIRADVQGWWDDQGNGLSVGLSTELALSMITVGGGASISGLADGGADFGGFGVMASVSDDGHGALWERPRVARVALTGSLSTRSHAALVHTLLRAARDPAVRGVLLVPSAGFSGSLAELMDLRWMVQRVQRAGKLVACSIDEGSGSAYFICAGADRLVLNVAGGVRLSGLRMTTLYLGDVMDRLGVAYDVIRIGEYKSAPEQLTEAGPSEAAQEQTNAYLSSIYRRWIWDLAQDRDVSTSRMMELVDGGPYLAEEAVEAGLADAAVFADEVEDELETLFGRRYLIDRDYAASKEHLPSWRGGPAVGVIHVEGNITDGDGWEAGPRWFRSTGAKSVVKSLAAARADRSIKALVLRIDSPGGTVLGSDLMWRAVRRAAKEMPVVASMGGVAASGGYYVACAADEIYAAPTTLTGSIGIFYGKLQLSALLEKIGVHPFHYKRGRRAGHRDWTRPWTEDERATIAQKVQTYYDRFLDRVVTGRDAFDSRSQVDEIARGRIWSGSMAKQRGLVDHIGGLQHAVERAAELAGLGRRYDVRHLPRRKRTLVERAVSLIGLHAKASQAPIPPAVDHALEVAAPLLYAEPERAQALLPFAFELEL